MQRHDTYLSTSSDGSRYSYETQDSRSTAPTSIHQSPRPSLQQYATDRPIYSAKPSYDSSPSTTYYPRSSTETYASTTASQDELVEEPESYYPEYEVPEYTYNEEVESNIRPSTPSDFAEFFPSSKRMYIRHDDTTYDGNMNLRVDTEDSSSRKKTNVQLFHLRMPDLKKMEFSLRRYERSSGREVCNSKRKFTKANAERRPALTRSVSNALTSIRGAKPEIKRTNSGLSTHSTKSSKSSKSVRRQDSGYASNEEDDEVGYFMSEKSSGADVPTNITKLEFSNYAQVEIKRKGAKSSKRWEYEYWGHTYTWKRVTEKDGEGKAVSYHLYRNDGVDVAHIVPEMQSPSQMRAEKAAGGWVPPCSMFISDKSVLEASVADVIVASGLIALVDDCIKRRFHSKTKHHQVSLPLTPLKMDMEFVGPRAMVEHMFKRRNSGGSTKEREQRGSPLRFAQPVAAY